MNDRTVIDRTVEYLIEIGRDRYLVERYVLELSEFEPPKGMTKDEYVSKALREVFGAN